MANEAKHTQCKLFWNEGSADIFANWYGDKNVTIAKVVSPEWHEDSICGGREAGANAARIVRCWNSHAALVDALEALRSDCQSPIDTYERNGPQWTSPQGNEYEDTSYVIAKFSELVASIDAALRLAKGEADA